MSDTNPNETYWEETAPDYVASTQISLTDFHYGPLLPGDSDLGLIPDDVTDWLCLEIASGAGHNSISLARRGAICTAMDLSPAQLAVGKTLAAEQNLQVNYQLVDMDKLPPLDTYKLIHTNSLNFSNDPAALLSRLADALEPGGTLIASAIHPLFHGEWLEIEEGEQGLFLSDYFDPEDDIRAATESGVEIHSRSYPISQLFTWIREAGLTVDALLEPAAVNVSDCPDKAPESVPYYSKEWAEWYGQLSKMPVMCIFKAIKPNPT